MVRQRRVTCALGVALSYLLLLAVISVYSIGAYYWAMRINRGSSQAINPVIYPLFSLVNTSTARDPYYLWQVYDLVADGYATQRRGEGRHIRVPIIYIHGNGGHYFCARSLTRFVYESNARERRRALERFPRHVKERLYLDYYAQHPIHRGSNASYVVPAWLQRQAEEAVVQEEMPLLGAELYALDFYEESNTHSGLITMKEARFLNHSLHVLHERFMRTFADVLRNDDSSPLQEKAVTTTPSLTRTDTMYTQGRSASRSNAVAQVEMDYLQSVCANPVLGHDALLCRRARRLLRRHPSLPRLRREVKQVSERGFWIWAESLGGSVGVLAAMMEPRLCAGIVLIGTPTRYPPLFFDEAEMWLYRIWDDALLRYYPNAFRQHFTVDTTIASSHYNKVKDLNALWAREVLPHENVLDLLRHMRDRDSSELAARLENVTIITINGGALDDVVPSVSNYVLHATARMGQARRRADVYRAVCPAATAYRRDISTEMLRGCGVPMDHRGLVYGLQFLQPSADALVQAALLPNSHALFGPEDALPSLLRRDPLFASVLETLPMSRYARQVEAFRFAATVRETRTGTYELRQRSQSATEEKEEDEVEGGEGRSMTAAVREGLHEQYREVCSRRSEAFVVNVGALPRMDDLERNQYGLYSNHTDGEEWMSEGDVQLTLRLLLGVTTIAPEDMYLPELRLTQVLTHAQNEYNVSGAGVVVAVPVTRMHLPYIRKNVQPIAGRTLRTAVSFRLARTASTVKTGVNSTFHARFCFYVPRHVDTAVHHSFVQHDAIDTRPFIAQANQADIVRQKATAVWSLSPLAWLWRWLSSPFALLHIRHYSGYVLLRGVDSVTQETRLTVTANSSSSSAGMIDPVVLCGSLHAFYLTLRGTGSLALDEAADGMQYLYGPPDPTHNKTNTHTTTNTHTHGGHVDTGSLVYRHTWKPYNVYPWNWNTTYMIYVLTDRTIRPELTLHDLETMAKGNVDITTGILSASSITTGGMREQVSDLAQALLRWAEKWPEYWLAYFAGASDMGKLGGAYVLYFYSLYFFFGAAERKMFALTSKHNTKGTRLPPQMPRLLRALRTLHPLSASLLTAALLQLVTSAWCQYAMKVCLDRDPQCGLSDAAMTARMDYREKLTLILLYDLAPRYRECQYSWIWMHDASWTLFAEKMAGIYLGTCIGAILLVATMLVTVLVRLVTWPLRLCLLRPLLRRLPRLAALFLTLMWAAPTLLWYFVLPWLPICYVYCLSSLLAHTVLALLPRRPSGRGSWSLWWAGFFACMASLIPAHFEGLVLTVRNQLIMKPINEAAFWDAERYLLTPRQKMLYALVQLGLAVLYVTVFLYSQQAHVKGLSTSTTTAVARKRRQSHVKGKNVAIVVSLSSSYSTHNNSSQIKQQQEEEMVVEEEKTCVRGYVMGDLGKRCPRWSRLVALCQNVLLVMSLRGGLVAMRRPMEGAVVVMGTTYIFLYLTSCLLRAW